MIPEINVKKKKPGFVPRQMEFDACTPIGLSEGHIYLVVPKDGLRWRRTPNFLDYSDEPYPSHMQTVRGEIIDGAEGEDRDFLYCGRHMMLPFTDIHDDLILKTPEELGGTVYMHSSPRDWPEVQVTEGLESANHC